MAAIAEAAGGLAALEVDAIGGVVGSGQRRDVVVVAGVDERVAEDERSGRSCLGILRRHPQGPARAGAAEDEQHTQHTPPAAAAAARVHDDAAAAAAAAGGGHRFAAPAHCIPTERNKRTSAISIVIGCSSSMVSCRAAHNSYQIGFILVKQAQSELQALFEVNAAASSRRGAMAAARAELIGALRTF